MAKTPVIDTTRAEDGEFLAIINQQDDTQHAWDEWGEALQGADSPGEVRCYRLPIDPNTGKPTNAQGQQEYLCKVPFDQYTFDSLLSYLRESFMDPDEKYMTVRLAGFKKGERGNKFSRVVTIRQDRVAAQKARSAPAAEHVASSAESIMRTMQEMMAKQLQTVQSLQPSTPNGGNIDAFVKVATVVGPMMLPFITALATRMTSPTPAAPGANLKEQLETLAMLRDIAGGGGGSDDSSMMGLIKAVGPSALQALGAIAQQRAQLTAPPVPHLNAPPNRPMIQTHPTPPVADVPAPVAPTPSPSSTEPAAMNMQQLNAVMLSLTNHAEHGSDPASVAAALLDTLSDAEGDELATRLADEKALDQLSFFFPQVKAHRAWFDQLRAALLAEFDQEPDAPR